MASPSRSVTRMCGRMASLGAATWPLCRPGSSLCCTHSSRYRELWVQHKDDPGRHNGHVAAPKLAIRPHILVTERDGEAMDLIRPAHELWASHIAYFST